MCKPRIDGGKSRPFLIVFLGPVSLKSGEIILFVSSKRRRLEARNFAVIFIFIPFTRYEKTSFTELAAHSFTTGFSGHCNSCIHSLVKIFVSCFF